MDISDQARGCQSSDPLELSAAVESLPDEVLLMVMKYLDVGDLLTCRLVCKRFGVLAMDPDVWWHRNIDCDREPSRACAVLRLAPWLNSLTMVVPYSWCSGFHLYSTKCAVARLDLKIQSSTLSGSYDIKHYVKSQCDLGYLVGLHVHVNTHLDAFPARELLDLLTSTADLEELSICIGYVGSLLTKRPHLEVACGPSLKYFELEWRVCDIGDRLPRPIEDVCRFLLAEHATTLEQVVFRRTPVFDLHELASMPNLRALHCSAFPGMRALAANASLRELYLLVTPETVGPDTREFLRAANQLRDVTLAFSTLKDDGNDGADRDYIWQPTTAGVDLVLDLVSSGRSSLERLCITNIGLYFPQEQPLLRALPLLTCLQHLKVDSAPDELLLGITPTTAPALQSLVVDQTNWPCTHAWLHREVVKKLLSVNPSLHVHVTTEFSDCDPPESYCEVCSEYECHPWLCKSEAVFFTHDPEDNCSMPEMHDDSDSCCYVSDVSAIETTVIVVREDDWTDLPFGNPHAE
ncbi:uncharacterized protein LOC127750123 [Frankliniella occidentalis]|uniref:Uncharacterized protein LOC127750123 n=1 Tax=Frankliniella occidentalis TaxID=133901 RepID=A0A9C6U7F3_FRAOC|nr:uncharacterized protein LOC127750123 [Frankliniella occidentalis]